MATEQNNSAGNSTGASNTGASGTPSPWTPPRAAVDDRQSLPAIPRPRQVTRALWGAWIGLAVAIALCVVVLAAPAAEPDADEIARGAEWFGKVVGGIFMLLLLGLCVWINIALARGREWARIIYLVLTGLSLAFLPFTIFGYFVAAPHWAEALLNLASYAIGLYVAFLLLTPAVAQWFRAHGGR